jgi:hypothetical protein
MRIRNLELWSAMVVIVIITAVYLGLMFFSEVPAASGLIGHSLGIIGFVLMLMTEILYSLRKRYLFARWGKLQHWLSFHIFTGLVGPYLVLLHSSWKFNGLAGILMLMTLIIVGSGFIGRYFYTAVPRAADGTMLEVEQLDMLIEENQQQLGEWRSSHPELVGQADELLSAEGQRPAATRRRWRRLIRNAPQENRRIFMQLREFWERQQVLYRQLGSVAGARRMLAVWHTLHIPLGAATFAVAFVHIAAALYYATFLH